MYSYVDISNDVELNDDICLYELDHCDCRAILEAQWIIDNNSSIRKASKEFGVGKSTTHRDCSIRLKNISIVLYDRVKKIFNKNYINFICR